MSFVALFIGRFQPFHNGHVDAINQILKDKPSKIIIGIGSSESELTQKNPFSYYERKEMLQIFIDNQKLTCFKIYPIPDFDNPRKWTNYILKNLPEFDTLYSGNPYTASCFENTDKQIKNLQINKFVKAVHIRQLIAKDLNWQKSIPIEISKYLIKIKSVKRLQEIEKFEDELNQKKYTKKNLPKNYEAKNILIIEKYTDWECLQMENYEDFDYDQKLEKLKTDHQKHNHTKNILLNTLKEYKLDYNLIKSDQILKNLYKNSKVIIPLGGDGTFLKAMKFVNDQLVCGVNSQPDKSVGKLTLFRPDSLEIMVHKISLFLQRKKLQTHSWPRLSFSVNGKEFLASAVNEIFIGLDKIYKTSHLKVVFDLQEGYFDGNGILISTHQGMTAFYASSRGKEFKPNQVGFVALLNYKKRGQLKENFIFNTNQEIIIQPERLGHYLVVDSDDDRKFNLLQGDEVKIFINQKNSLKILKAN